MHETLPLLEISSFPALKRHQINTLQVNLGYKCNQRCLHCHVNAGPDRKEMMTPDVMDLLMPVIDARGVETLDLTGGAPELHDGFRDLVVLARSRGVDVIDRCNLTVLFEPGQEDLAPFLAEQGVTVTASLPCYSEKNVDQQRGDGVFDKSIRGLQWLNKLGYASHENLQLNLVFNPLGPELPPNQQALEAEYKERLFEDFGIRFNQLFTVTNMPIKRFGSTLISKGEFHEYMELLKDNYQASNLKNLMCRSMISVDWQGFLYDCDFNQLLELPLGGAKRPHLSDLLYDDFRDDMISVADHCFGCTAGQGSSCGGALV